MDYVTLGLSSNPRSFQRSQIREFMPIYFLLILEFVSFWKRGLLSFNWLQSRPLFVSLCSSKMATDDQDDTTLPPNRAVVIGLSQYERDKSLVYCLEVFENEEFTGSPFRLYKEDGGYVWENKQLRLQKITLGSFIVFERKRTGNSSNHCYLENTKTIWVSNGLYVNYP